MDCNIEKELYEWQGRSGDMIYISKDGKYIIKELNKKISKNLHEINNTKTIMKLLKDYDLKYFFASIKAILDCKESYMIITPKYVDAVKYLIPNISKEEQINVFKQIIIAVLFLNYELNIYHNDLGLLNIVYKIVPSDNKIKYKIRNVTGELELCKYHIKIIDFERIKDKYKHKHYYFLKYGLSTDSAVLTTIIDCVVPIYNEENLEHVKIIINFSKEIKKNINYVKGNRDLLFKHDIKLFKLVLKMLNA